MANINLLPWREEQRAQQDKKLFIASILFWGLCIAAGFLAFGNISGRLDDQRARNQYLLEQNSRLNREIKDIEKLQQEKQELIERIDVIQNLQQDRVQIVHVFDDIVRKMPPGVTLDKMRKDDSEIQLFGRAQSNSRVSELMNQLDSSRWFGNSDLSIVSLKETDDGKLSEFEVAITEKARDLDEVEEGQ